MDAGDSGILLIRLVIGGFFAGHGCQLLLGWFGGGGLSRTRASFHNQGFRPALPFAFMAASTQLVCGLGMVFGFLWPFPAVLLTGPMVVAVVQVHWPRIWVTQSGIEYPTVMGVVVTGVGLLPVGAASLDNAFGIDLPQVPAYLVALAMAQSVAIAAIVMARITKRREAAAAPGAETPAAAGSTQPGRS
jgi:putative oxidoreductase